MTSSLVQIICKWTFFSSNDSLHFVSFFNFHFPQTTPFSSLCVHNFISLLSGARMMKAIVIFSMKMSFTTLQLSCQFRRFNFNLFREASSTFFKSWLLSELFDGFPWSLSAVNMNFNSTSSNFIFEFNFTPFCINSCWWFCRDNQLRLEKNFLCSIVSVFPFIQDHRSFYAMKM